MWRFMHAAAIAALIGSAAYVYGVKYQTIYASEQLVKTRHLIDKEKNAINLLRAELPVCPGPTGSRRWPIRNLASSRWR